MPDPNEISDEQRRQDAEYLRNKIAEMDAELEEGQARENAGVTSDLCCSCGGDIGLEWRGDRDPHPGLKMYVWSAKQLRIRCQSCGSRTQWRKCRETAREDWLNNRIISPR